MATESCRHRQPSDDVVIVPNDATTRRYDNDDEDLIGDYSGHLAVAMPTPAITVQSAAREPADRLPRPDDFSTSGLWSQPKRKSTKPEMANGGGRHVDVGQVCRFVCIVSAQLIVSARLRAVSDDLAS